MAGSGVAASHATVSIQGKPLAGARLPVVGQARNDGHERAGHVHPRRRARVDLRPVSVSALSGRRTSASPLLLRPAYPACRSSSTPIGLADGARVEPFEELAGVDQTRRPGLGRLGVEQAATVPGARRRRSAQGSAPVASRRSGCRGADEGRRCGPAATRHQSVIHSDRNP
jgi:hypothetical protein